MCGYIPLSRARVKSGWWGVNVSRSTAVLPIGGRMRWLPLVAVVLMLVLAEVAAAATPAAYRTKVNGICRGYSPTLKKLATQVNHADAAKDYRTWGVAVSKWLTLDLTEDRGVEAVPVPAPLEAEMSPILVRM